MDCNCWVHEADFPLEADIPIRAGMHLPSCPVYEESSDPDDARIRDQGVEFVRLLAYFNELNALTERAAQSLTPAERIQVRESLSGLGFHRQDYTADNGDGVYAEFWLREDELFTFTWGPRKI